MDMNSDALNLPVFFQNGDFDTHFKVFHELMSNKVFEILLVASPYDAYILKKTAVWHPKSSTNTAD